MNTHTNILLALCIITSAAKAQLKVGAPAGAPDASAMLQVESTNKGLRLPQVSLTNTTTFAPVTTPTSAPAAVGLYVYSLTIPASTNPLYPTQGNGAYYWDGSGWVSSNGAAALAAQDLRLIGVRNHITKDAGIGTNGTAMGGGDNIALGSNTMGANTSGTRNVAMNTFALQSNISGSQNIAIGQEALNLNTTASNNIALGYQSLKANTNGTDNVAIGNGTLTSNASGGGTGSIAIGALALNKNDGTFGLHVGIGFNALQNNTTGYANVGMGYSALNANTTGSFNTSIGTSSMNSSLTGNQNTAVGYQTMYYANGGAFNTALGSNALSGIISTPMSGSNNVAIGFNAGSGISTGNQNTAIGKGALAATVNTGNSNTAVGFNALNAFTTGGSNVGLGEQALLGLTTGFNNIAIGPFSAPALAVGSNNILIGGPSNLQYSNNNPNTPAASSRSDYQLQIGDAITGQNMDGKGPNNHATISIGNDNAVVYRPNNYNYTLDVSGQIHATGSVISGATVLTSDARLKRNIVPVSNALASVLKLNAVSYEKKESIGSYKYNMKETGFIAQEVQKVFPDLVIAQGGKDNLLGVNYVAIIPVLAKAIQEQQAAITAKDAKITTLETRLEKLEKIVEAR